MSRTTRDWRPLICTAVALLIGASVARAGSRVVVLNNDSQVRIFRVMKTPKVVDTAGKSLPVITPASTNHYRHKPRKVPDFESPAPVEGWQQPGFDATSWTQTRAPVETRRGRAARGNYAAMHSATKSALICCRSYFKVSNPGVVRDLQLSLEYVGGAIVYINGKEIARGHLPKGQLKPGSPADRYPDDLYVEPGNKYLHFIKDNPKGFARRYRALTGIKVPAKLLRKGSNVLALEIHRAPVNAAATRVKIKERGGMGYIDGLWAYVGLRKLELSADSGAGIEPNTGRPPGVQAWVCEVTDTVTSFGYSNPAEPSRPVLINAARNGTYVGRFVLSSSSDIKGLKVSTPVLMHADGKTRFAEEAVQLRHARPVKRSESWLFNYRFDGLLPGVPQSVPVINAKPREETSLDKKRKYTRECTKSGAVVPIWLTVKVPESAKPGKYKGSVKISSQGQAAKTLPVEMEIFDWRLPSPKDFRIKHTNTFSPDSIALYYKVPYWSDRHMELMGKSMKLMADIGARQATLHLARYTLSSRGSKHHCMDTMVRWKKKADGGYEYDFSALDKYLDLVEKTMGSPRPLRVNFWTETRKKPDEWYRPCPVSQIDSAGKVSELEQPAPGSAESVKFWKPVLAKLRKRIEKRGWWKATTVGHSSYCWNPTPPLVEAVRQIWPDARWSYTAHNGVLGRKFKGDKGKPHMPIAVSVCVWTEGKLKPRGYRALLKPGREKLIWNSVCRNYYVDTLCKKWPYKSTLLCHYRLIESVIMRGHDGIGYMSSEVFPIENPKRKGRYYRMLINAGGVAGASTKSLLAPGKDGPIPTERYEAMRQSVQECEAILYLQKALENKAIGGELADKVDGYLQIRGEAFLKGLGTGRAGNRELLGLAAEVAKATSK